MVGPPSTGIADRVTQETSDGSGVDPALHKVKSEARRLSYQFGKEFLSAAHLTGFLHITKGACVGKRDGKVVFRLRYEDHRHPKGELEVVASESAARIVYMRTIAQGGQHQNRNRELSDVVRSICMNEDVNMGLLEYDDESQVRFSAIVPKDSYDTFGNFVRAADQVINWYFERPGKSL